MHKGIGYAAGAYFLWGVFPIYFKWLQNVPAFQIVAHRVVWSFLLLILLVAARREMGGFRKAIQPRTIGIYFIAGIFLSINWLTYVWAVNAGFMVDASLGYFINPLVNVLLGVVFLREKLRPAQWLPIGLAGVGVAYLTFSHGSFPWIALILATSFGAYGLIKKIAPLGSLYGLTLETALMLVFALGYLFFVDYQGSGAFIHAGASTSLLLFLTGVITIIPLLLFASGARRVPLSTMGLIQYLSPTLQFLSGVLLFKEPFTLERLIGFCIIWLALIVFSAESFLNWQKGQPLAGQVEVQTGI